MVGLDSRHQKLAAILAADAAGYSRLMAFDESGTVTALDAARGVFRTQIELNHGRVVDMAGDSVLALFETATGAVSAALAVQTQIEADLVGVPADRRMRFRIGVHLGDVIQKADGSIYGDGVNIAARLQTLAQPGGVTVSDAIQGAVRNRIVATFEDLGEQPVKNIADPVRVFRVVKADAGGTGFTRGKQALGSMAQRASGRRWGAVALFILLAAIGAAAWVGDVGRVGWPAGGAARSQAAAPITMSLAVGAFTAPANDVAAQQAAKALTQDIATGLGAVERTLRVVSPSTSQEAGASIDFRERALQAGARYVVEGDVRMAGGHRIVGLRLVETQRGTQTWSRRIELPESNTSFEGLAAARDMILQLASAVQSAEVSRVSSKPVDRLDPMELVVRAWAVRSKGETIATAREMRKLLDDALRLDPTLVPALVLMGWQLALAQDVDPLLDRDRFRQEVDEFSARAVQNDPDHHQAWGWRATALTMLGRWNAALQANDQEIKLDPFGGRGYAVRAEVLVGMGRPADALVAAGQALALAPSNPGQPLSIQCLAHLLLGEADKAISSCERATGLDPHDRYPHYLLAAAYANAGDISRARVAVKTVLNINPGFTIGRLRADQFSNHPEYQKLAEKYFYDGLRTAGLQEK